MIIAAVEDGTQPRKHSGCDIHCAEEAFLYLLLEGSDQEMTGLWWAQTNWYAIQSKPGKESSAAASISRLGVEVFLPVTERVRPLRGVLTIEMKPLFPSYLFARFCPSLFFRAIQYARGVRRVISAGGALLPVDAEIISTIRSRTAVAKQAPAGMCPSLKPGDRVKVERGPLQGLVGIFEKRMSGQQRVSILLETIACQARVSVDYTALAREGSNVCEART